MGEVQLRELQPHDEPVPEVCEQLKHSTEAVDGTCMRVLGATVQVGKAYYGEWE